MKKEDAKLMRYFLKMLTSLGYVFFHFVVFAVAGNVINIDMNAIAMVESSMNPKAYNKRTEAKGLYQITPIVLKQYIEQGGEKGDLFDREYSEKVARYYIFWLMQRTKTVEELLIAWNWGIGNLRKYQAGKKRLPKETKDFIRKYKSYAK
jgi:hypothetical protein